MTQSKKKKFLVVTPLYARTETSSGPGSFVRDLCNMLADDGFLVDVVVPHERNTKAVERYNNITIYRFHCIPQRLQPYTHETQADSVLTSSKVDYAWLMVYRYSLSRKLKQLMNRYTYEAIHAHWLSPQGWCVAKTMEKLQISIPLICSAYGRDLNAQAGGVEAGARQLAVSKSTAITVSSSLAKELIMAQHPQMAPRKVTVLHPSVDLQNLFCRMPYVKRQKHALLFVGNLTPDSGLQHLIPALAIIKEQVPQIQLYIVGEGPAKEANEELAREYGCYQNLQFVGALPPPSVALFLNKARFLVCPTIAPEHAHALNNVEQMRLTCAQAMGCKCPVLCTKIDGIKTLVTDRQTGITFRPEDPKDIAKQVLWAFEHAQEVKEITQKAADHVKNHFDQEQARSSYLNLMTGNTKAGASNSKKG